MRKGGAGSYVIALLCKIKEQDNLPCSDVVAGLFPLIRGWANFSSSRGLPSHASGGICFSRASRKIVHWTIFSLSANTQTSLLAPNSNPTPPTLHKKRTPLYRVPTRDFFGKAVLFKSQAWRNATPFLVLFNFLHLINHQNRVNLLLQLNCR